MMLKSAMLILIWSALTVCCQSPPEGERRQQHVGAARLSGPTCIAWAEPAVSFYCGSFSIELVYRTSADAERLGPGEEMLALVSNLRAGEANDRHGRHFQVLLDDRLGGEGKVVVRWLSRHWKAEGLLESAKGILDGKFHRIAVHRDAEAGTVELAVDGESVSAELQAGVDLETQDQATVIGGCFAGRYRAGDIGFLRVYSQRRELGGLLFQESDAVFSGNSSFLIDRSTTANDFWWIGFPLTPKFVAVPLIRAMFPMCTDRSSHQPNHRECWWDHHHHHHHQQPLQHHSQLQATISNKQNVIISSLLSTGGGAGTPSLDQENSLGIPFYFLSFASDCRRLLLHCVVVCDEVSMPRDRAALYSSQHLQFFHISLPRRESAVRSRVWGFLEYLEKEHLPQYLLHLDLRDGRINRDPFAHIQEQLSKCDLLLQAVSHSVIYCAGVHAGSRQWMEKLWRAWGDKMRMGPAMDDQGAFNVVVRGLEGARLCTGPPLISPQHLRTYSKQDFIEHGNWVLDSTLLGKWGEVPHGD